MTEQLSLDDLLAGESAAKNSKTPAPKRPVRTQSRAENSIDARINALVEKKKLAETEQKYSKVVSEEVIAVDVNGDASLAELIDSQAGTRTESVPQEKPQVQVVLQAEPEVLSVSALNRSIKGLLEKSYPFLWV